MKRFTQNGSKDKKQNTGNKKPIESITLVKSLEQNISVFENTFPGDSTLIIRRFQNKYLTAAKCCIIYFEGMVDVQILNETVLEPILNQNLEKQISSGNLLEEMQYKVIESNNVKITTDMNSIVSSVMYGDTLFLLEGYDKAIIIDSKGWPKREVSEPESSKVVRGPRQGFTESVLINLSLIRRIVRSADLRVAFREIGSRTRTKVCVCYINGVAAEGVVKELEQRLDKIEIDAVLDSGYIQELIRDAPFSPFETVGASERPDAVAAKLLEGRVALVVDGSPFVLTVPFVLAESTQATEDYYNNYIYSSFNRIIRSFGSILAISIPALFLALVTFHQEMIPTQLLLSIAASRQGVPFPTVLSLFLMLLVFDILREAGTRMPSPIGQAVNIVGTLVLGEAAIQAKLVSAPVVIVTALTGILTLMNISLIGPTIVLRFFLLLATSILGVYGYLFGMILIFIHLMSIRSFGVPFMLGLSRVRNHDGQDAWIRAPWWTLTLRPKVIGAKNLVRQTTRKNRGK